MADIAIHSVTKQYANGHVAIEDVDLDVADGELLVLVGPSGCGKSTLLRMVAGLEELTEGSIAIGGRDVTDLAPKDRDIAMVFQSYALYPNKTVHGNIAYPLKLAKVPGSEIDRREGRGEAAPAGHGPQSTAGAAVGRPATARRNGSRHRSPTPGLPDGRAALEPRRQAACRCEPRSPHSSAVSGSRRCTSPTIRPRR